MLPDNLHSHELYQYEDPISHLACEEYDAACEVYHARASQSKASVRWCFTLTQATHTHV